MCHNKIIKKNALHGNICIYVNTRSYSPIALIDFHRRIQLSQLFFQQLQIRIDEAQLESDGVAQLAICGGLQIHTYK